MNITPEWNQLLIDESGMTGEEFMKEIHRPREEWGILVLRMVVAIMETDLHFSGGGVFDEPISDKTGRSHNFNP